MLSLTNETKKIIEILFPGTYASEVTQLLIEECGNNIPFCENHTPEEMERIRYSVLRTSNGNFDFLKNGIELAKRDWRDLLLNAGFGYNIKEHKKWAKRLLAEKTI